MRKKYLIITIFWDTSRSQAQINNNWWENGTKKSGGFGIVNFAQNKITGKKYAAKTSHQPDNANNKKHTFRELNILANIHHPTIVHFHGVSYKDFEHRDNITIFTDYMENGSLADILIKERKTDHSNWNCSRNDSVAKTTHSPQGFETSQRFTWWKFQTVSNRFWVFKKIFDSKSQSIVDCVTPAYMSPEVITSAYFNCKADVYSFGILMFEVVSGFRPYSELLRKGISDFNLKTKILNGERPSNIVFISMEHRCWMNKRAHVDFLQIKKMLLIRRIILNYLLHLRAIHSSSTLKKHLILDQWFYLLF